eukprot:scpid103704/ scgid12704/ 
MRYKNSHICTWSQAGLRTRSTATTQGCWGTMEHLSSENTEAEKTVVHYYSYKGGLPFMYKYTEKRGWGLGHRALVDKAHPCVHAALTQETNGARQPLGNRKPVLPGQPTTSMASRPNMENIRRPPRIDGCQSLFSTLQFKTRTTRPQRPRKL